MQCTGAFRVIHLVGMARLQTGLPVAAVTDSVIEACRHKTTDDTPTTNEKSRPSACLAKNFEAKFVAEALKEGLSGVKGHRSVGGMRASIYTAMSYEGAEKLAKFMDKFRKANA